MSETRDNDNVMTESELVEAVNKVIELVGNYSDLCAESSELIFVNADSEDITTVNKKASETYRDILGTLYDIASTYTIDGHTEYFNVRERRCKSNE